MEQVRKQLTTWTELRRTTTDGGAGVTGRRSAIVLLESAAVFFVRPHACDWVHPSIDRYPPWRVLEFASNVVQVHRRATFWILVRRSWHAY